MKPDELCRAVADYDALIVRSATKVRQDLIDACPNLKIIARGGVGLDNVDAARNFGMTALLFTNPDQLRHELISLGLTLEADPGRHAS